MIGDLISFLDASPSPFHVVATAGQRLAAAGFVVQDFSGVATVDFSAPKGAIRRDGSLIAWSWPVDLAAIDALVLGAHTDSPTLRIKPRGISAAAGFDLLEVEIYGGVLLNSWLDRDLGVAGVVRSATGDARLVNIAKPLARVPQLAIHLDRDVNEKGLVLNRQTHMRPVWSTSSADFGQLIAGAADTDRIDASNLVLYDVAGASLLGGDDSLLASGRLDNQVSCWAAVSALVSAPARRPVIVALFDHEEVGSESTTGAAGPMLELVLREIVRQRDVAWFDFVRSALCVSADNAHALHPNFPDRHDANHAPIVNHGPALKTNANQRYATSLSGAARVRSVANSTSIPLQEFVSNNAIPCGSTIGPITATRLGIETVDIGVPQLSMHSARELCGVADPILLRELFLALANG